MVVHDFDSSSWKAESRGSLSLNLAWFTERVPEQLGLLKTEKPCLEILRGWGVSVSKNQGLGIFSGREFVGCTRP